MANKVTRKDSFNELRALAVAANRSDLTEFIDHQLSLLENKSSSSADVKRKAENNDIKRALVSALTSCGAPVTIKTLQTNSAVLEPLSNQKIAQLLSQLVEAGVVVRAKDKRQTVFSLA